MGGVLAAEEKVVCIAETASFTDTNGTFIHFIPMRKEQLPKSCPSSLTEDQLSWEAACVGCPYKDSSSKNS